MWWKYPIHILSYICIPERDSTSEYCYMVRLIFSTAVLMQSVLCKPFASISATLIIIHYANKISACLTSCPIVLPPLVRFRVGETLGDVPPSPHQLFCSFLDRSYIGCHWTLDKVPNVVMPNFFCSFHDESYTG